MYNVPHEDKSSFQPLDAHATTDNAPRWSAQPALRVSEVISDPLTCVRVILREFVAI